ncbi:hypothetical protein [Lysinibacillus xylanilyticus]|uniref:hypothetical protein n=1 Tax=Lysinibacillus xylanilyticus TaxID=582475 RepID=UPI003D072227
MIHKKKLFGQDEEYTDKNKDRETYLPIWVEVENVSIEVKPKEVPLKIYSLFKKKIADVV